MTYKEVAEMVKSLGLPFAYYQFPDGTEIPTPFVVYFYSDSDDLMADNVNYQKIRSLNIELYTDEKDFELESALEDMLSEHELTYYKEQNYIGSEKMYQTAYEMEVIING